MPTAKDVIAVALTQVGITEYPPGSNNVKYNTAYYGREVSGSAFPWCVCFVWWVFQEAGASELFYGGKKTASCNTLKGYYDRYGHVVNSGYKPGDLALMGFGDPDIRHIGIITGINADGTISTIEGNTSTTSDDNGGAVMRRTRRLSDIVCAARPDYDEEQEKTEQEEIEVITFDQWKEQYDEFMSSLKDNDSSEWSEKARLSQTLCKPPRRCKIEAPTWRFAL